MIPMIDLGKQFEDIKEEISEAITKILNSSHYILGPNVLEFEKRVAAYMGVSDSIGVASGTDALHLALEALGIGEGDEVITTPFTFFATVEAIIYTGATPVFVDIELDTFNMDCSKLEEKINSKTKAILPVHLFGHPADMGRIMELSDKYRLSVIEDCAQAFGAEVNGRKVGSLGHAGGFSFYPSKNLGAFGDGGLITVNDKNLADDIRSLRNHGSKGAYIHDRVGFNSRLDEIQAGILLIKLNRIDAYNRKRREKAALYNTLLSDAVKQPSENKGFYHVYNQYTIMSNKREAIQKRLKEENISSVVYYPKPLHLQEAVSFLKYKAGDFPLCERAAQEVLSLPIYPELEEAAIKDISVIINSVAE